MRISMVSALCVVFGSAGLSGPAAAQVDPPMNPGDSQSIQAERPTTAQSDPQPPAKLPDLRSLQTWGGLLTSPTQARPGWRQFGKVPEDQACAGCAHIQIYEAPPNLDPKIIVEQVPRRLLPLPPSDSNIAIYHGLPPCPKDVHPFRPFSAMNAHP